VLRRDEVLIDAVLAQSSEGSTTPTIPPPSRRRAP
jgi:hypothetical protein